MPSWSARQYLKFSDERTRPCRDLAARISVPQVRRIIDLGCGPGNSAEILAERWPDAEITGLDNSAEMIENARRSHPARRWLTGDLAEWAARSSERFDIVFSNAALQWVGAHETVFPLMARRVAPGGALAVQMPCNNDAPAHTLMRELAASPAWRRWFPEGRVREWFVHDAGFYYDVLAPVAARVDLWETEYLHILPDAEAIVEWYKGSGMRPFLDAIGEEAEKIRFAAEYLERIRTAYPRRPDGRVLFPFRRLFVIAYRAAD